MDLIKKDDRWDLYNEDGHKIASTLDGCLNKLSLKNCQAIENGYDLDGLVDEVYPVPENSILPIKSMNMANRRAFKAGFQKALSILSDKKFSEEDLKQSMWDLGDALYNNCQNGIKEGEPEKYIKSIIQSLQQTEWDVEIVMQEDKDVLVNDVREFLENLGDKPLLDADGCLILKLKSE